MADFHSGAIPGLTSPGCNATAVSPSSAALANTSRALWIGGPTVGALVVDMAGAPGIAGTTSITFVIAAAGTLLPIRVIKVCTGTTCAAIVNIF